MGVSYTLLNVETPDAMTFAYKGPIIYDDNIHPQRIINRHAVDVSTGAS
jgi:hypothetical protein